MSIANAITAGIIYALTEMLALSGSGHLAVVNKLFDLHLTQMHLMLKAICEQLGFDSLGYQSLSGLLESIDLDPERICTYCWNGKE